MNGGAPLLRQVGCSAAAGRAAKAVCLGNYSKGSASSAELNSALAARARRTTEATDQKAETEEKLTPKASTAAVSESELARLRDKALEAAAEDVPASQASTATSPGGVPQDLAGDMRSPVDTVDISGFPLPEPHDDGGDPEIMAMHASCPDIPPTLPHSSVGDLQLLSPAPRSKRSLDAGNLTRPASGSAHAQQEPHSCEARAVASCSGTWRLGVPATSAAVPPAAPGPPWNCIKGAGDADTAAAPSETVKGRSPFWTCSTTAAHRRDLRRAAESGSSGGQSQVPGLETWLFGGVVASDLKGKGGTDNLVAQLGASQLGGAVRQVVDFLAMAIVEASADTAPPEDELTTVLMETKEQKLQWREFLGEAVSKCRASALFASYDVESEPPEYVLPPSSTRVAPKGADWSTLAGLAVREHPDPAAQKRSSDTAFSAWWLRGCRSSEMEEPASAARSGGSKSKPLDSRVEAYSGSETVAACAGTGAPSGNPWREALLPVDMAVGVGTIQQPPPAG
mmetsp:Transcript_68622/g.154128  ORF Transcript_68622/g.154128 Transcript_68622/m.154128 type:complete len:511 (-) Transcript_68622:113-1645(-)